MPSPLLTDNDRKEQLSLAYLHALAAVGGYTVSIPNLDRDSSDICISSGSSRRSSVEFQLKATSSPDCSADGLRFQLKAKNYNDLARRRQVPLLLAVMVLPELSADWLTLNPDKMVLRKCVYWMSLIGEPETDQGSKVVIVPIVNLLTVDSLRDLIQKSEDNLL
jgi:hypothetical protein